MRPTIPEYSRRGFLKSAGTGIALSSTSLFIGAARLSPNDRVRLAVIGTGGMGQNHCRRFSSLGEDVEVAAVCDVDPERRAKAAQELPNSSRVAQHADYRRILDGQKHRHGDCSHSGSLAHQNRPGGHSGGKTRLCRKALLSQCWGREIAAQSRQEIQKVCPARHSEP